jgi:aryl-alcohol dehydrogenase
MNSLKVTRKASIAVFGTGAVGLAAVMASRLVSADPIIGVDIKPKRLKLGLKLGATHAIDSRHQDVAACISDITSRGVDYVVETTGNPRMHQLAIDVLNPRGVVALLTGERGTDSLPGGRRTVGIIQGDAVPQLFIPKLIKLYRAGQFPFDRLVKFYEFRDINRAIADANRGDTIKPVLRISKA